MNQPHDDYHIAVTLKKDGTVDKTVVGSVVESLRLDRSYDKEYARLKEIFQKESLQLASFTITEKGYSLVNGKGEVLKDVAEDFKNGPQEVISYMGKVTALLYERFQANALPIAMVSMDNCSKNGDKLKAAIQTIALKWEENGFVGHDFIDYINDANKVSFPWSMIDKITPRPDASVEKILLEDGIEDLETICTTKGSYVAPFVNAEETEYLIIEDAFPNGKPEVLTKAGIIFTDRETVEKVEKMKVGTCLNPLHTTLAVFGCLLGHTLISKEMEDEDLVRLIKKIGYVEGLPVVVDPKIMDPKDFIDTVVNVRFPNPFMPDTPQRIATDTSQKLGVRFGGTVQGYMNREDLNVLDLKYIPLVYAGWFRYLMGVDDAGNTFTLSDDPLLTTVCPYVQNLAGKKASELEEILAPVLKDKKIFAVDLVEVGLAKKVCEYLESMLLGNGAVRKTIHEALES